MFRDSVSLFTNKVKEDGDYDEVSSFFAKSFKNTFTLAKQPMHYR